MEVSTLKPEAKRLYRVLRMGESTDPEYWDIVDNFGPFSAEAVRYMQYIEQYNHAPPSYASNAVPAKQPVKQFNQFERPKKTKPRQVEVIYRR